jgi:hypothetical protein
VISRVHPGLWLQLLALLPILMILELVQASSDLQWFDYWSVVPKIVDADGSLVPRDLLHFEESHVLALPGLIYWLNIQLTDGLNRTLAYFVVFVTAGQLLVLRALLPRPERLGHWVFGGLVVAFSALLFAPQLAWNFSRAMSGTAWLVANLLVLVAIACATRRRIAAAILVSGLASVTYGTGLVAWPAVLIVLALRGWTRRCWLVVSAAAVTAITYLLMYDPSRTTASSGLDPSDILRRVFQLLGSVLSPAPDLALLLGVACVVSIGYLTVRALATVEGRHDAAPWIAIAAFAFGSALLIGQARGGIHGEDIAVTSRYGSLAALAWVALLVLLVLALRQQPRAWLSLLAVTALAFVAGQPTLAAMKVSAVQQDELAIAMRLGLSSGYTYGPQDRFVPLFRSIGHYPFSDDFDADCGMLDRTISRGAIRTPEGTTGGNLDRLEPALNAQSVRMTGWFGSEDGDVRCILIADGSLRVIGAASYGYERPDLLMTSPTREFDLGFVGVAPAGASSYRAFAVVDGREGVYEIDGRLTGPEPPEPGP